MVSSLNGQFLFSGEISDEAVLELTAVSNI